MALGKKTGGRGVGTPNKITAEERRTAEQIMAEMGFDPIRKMIEIANSAERYVTPELRGKMASELAKYLHPQKRSVDHSINPNSGPLQHSVEVKFV